MQKDGPVEVSQTEQKAPRKVVFPIADPKSKEVPFITVPGVCARVFVRLYIYACLMLLSEPTTPKKFCVLYPKAYSVS